MQAPICKLHMDPLTLSAWTCFLSTLQSATLAFFLLPDQSAWKIHSLVELSCYIFVGAFGSGVNFFLQSWCISLRGPLYSAMFTPLSTMITTVLAAIFLHEELHIGSSLGGLAIVCGLYVVLWGKAEDERRGRVAAQSKDLAKATTSLDSKLDIEGTLAAPLLADGSGAQEPN
uniref:WAT1-related protein n=1 Tax=Arundo donax TaxID=35708 RepID=A0A0A8YEM5_ARUDO